MSATLAPALLVGLQVGLPRNLGDPSGDDPENPPWSTGIWKGPVEGPLYLGPTGPEGDGQADLVNHGGPDKTACVYASRWYASWRDELDLIDMPHGSFGENFTVEGLDESSVCVGDVFRIGEAIVQVSQPRQPCWKLGLRWQMNDLPARVVKSGRTGWYFRIIEPGLVRLGDAIERQDRPHPEWSIDEANRVMYRGRNDPDSVGRLADCPALSESWRSTLRSRVEKAAKHS